MGQELQLRRRSTADPESFVKCRMSVPASTNAHLRALQAKHCLRNRDAVIGALIRKGRTDFRLCDFALPPEPEPDDPMIDIYPSIQLDHVDFLYRLQRRFRGAAFGTTIEALVETVIHIRPLPLQLPLLLQSGRP